VAVVAEDAEESRMAQRARSLEGSLKKRQRKKNSEPRRRHRLQMDMITYKED
jgi:hypothetical protein